MAIHQVGPNGSRALWNHSNRIYSILQYNYLVFPCTLLLTFYGVRSLVDYTGYYAQVSDGGWTRSATIHAVLSAFFFFIQLPPYANTLGLCLPMQPFKYSKGPKTRRLGTLRVCLVTKGTNVQAAIKSARCWDVLTQRNHPSVRFHVLVDNDNGDEFRQQLPSYITVDQVPKHVPSKRALYKARALEHFRQKYKLSKEDWVLHLDEESEIDEHVMVTSLDFIERGTALFGNGTIYYTSTNHWASTFLSAAEVVRLAEDYGRFQLPFKTLRRPLLGWIHGSWMLINGEMENTIKWDTDNVCEDYWFGYHAAKHGFKFEWVHALFREQPPVSVMDLWRQRRRWYTGIWGVNAVTVRLALIAAGLGGLGIFVFPVTALFGMRIVVPSWYWTWMIFNDATNLHTLVVAGILQDLSVADISIVTIVYHAIISVILSPFAHILQTVALASALVVPSKGYCVIDKT
ncbi:hypothetical protein BO78DRAFT_166604 [Aspergillus sclerotiicarbonarius CBS 121057]|uniref:Glycosyltransferase 2-like domain-containing protein n=1 Tax=Aspergillus sclerotiicarbonarius (strain CBS 121057 / IBT 28362) TaxID=1448318 RepID=A0A319E918_ASPSB|nr:hypothetical protein BO78DRAFT_166604 [Aspergillus sclerotiicarbonarius CBS 121057]